MTSNEDLVRELYACAEGDRQDYVRFVSLFADDGYMQNMSSGPKLRGQAIGEALSALSSAFPDIHRELFRMHLAENVVVVELAVRGTHKGEMLLPTGSLAPTGKSIDVPFCDVFHIEQGKVTSFHCYNAFSVMLEQLGVLSATYKDGTT